jgi:hypothetical protein
MILHSSGIILTAQENSSFLHIASDAEAWVNDAIAEKAQVRQDALIKEWRPRLYADASVTELPANDDDLAALILARSDYRSRAQKDAAADPAEPISTGQRDKFAAVSRSGSTVTLFPSGITIADFNANCILAYVQNLEEWVIGAIRGQVSRGKKKMIRKYYPIIMADASVTEMPATEDGLITMILARADYVRGG